MPIQGQQLDGLCYIAWDVAFNRGKTGDSGNHVLRIIRDGAELVPANAPSEVDGGNCPGLYKINLTDSEMRGSVVTLAGRSTTANVVIVPVQLTTLAAAQFATYVISRTSTIWTDSQLQQWSIDALGQIATDLNCIWARECVPIQSGVSVILLPSYVRSLIRVTWRGKSLEPQSWEELQLLTPTTEWVSPGNPANRATSIGRPLFSAM